MSKLILDRASRSYPFPGGIASKLGDRFEAKWAVKKLFEVILGLADAFQFEFIASINQGVEFWLLKNGRKEWYQAKKQNVKGNWTIKRLETEGVLTTALAKLSLSSVDQFFFLSSAPATQLANLAQRAALVESGPTEFLDALSDEERFTHLESLQKAWETAPEVTWDYLRRLQIMCEPETDLDINLRMIGGRLFSDPYEKFFPILREYLENNFNRVLTTEIVHREIINGGILAPRAPLDPSLRERIVNANQRYLESYTPFDAGGTIIPRQETQEILDLITKETETSIILVTGNAGTGKSSVVRQILASLEERGATYLAFRVDSRLGIDSAAALGLALFDRRENPVFTLESLATSGSAILVIDQIDTISEVSGRTGAIREVVFELLSFAHLPNNIKIIAVCRSYDLANDSALRDKLEKGKQARQIEVKPLDWATEIKPLLLERELPVERITQKQRKLLTSPLNLALFLDVTEGNELVLSFQSTTDLFDRLIKKKERSIRDRGYPNFALMPALSELAAIMSRDQSLEAPAAALDHIPHALEQLSTEHLIVHLQGRVSFFHESLFDYAFARSFVTARKDILNLLKEDEQHLFRRTQVSQILAIYRQTGPRRVYLQQLRELLTSADVRYHIKDAVSRWLGDVPTPLEDELNIILILDRAERGMPALVRQAIYPQAGWLPSLIRQGLITNWLGSVNEERRDDALSILRNAVTTFPIEVIKVMRDWWQEDHERGAIVLGWLSWLPDFKPFPELLAINLDLIRSKPKGLFDRAGLYDQHSLSNWIKHDPDAAGEILRAWFDTWYKVFPEEHPFDRNGQNDLDYHWIEELQKKSSAAFLKAAIPAFVEAIHRINKSFDGQYPKDYTWQVRYDRDSYGANRFLTLLRKGLADITQTTPKKAIGYLTQIDPSSHPAAMFIWLETIGSIGEHLGHLLPTLLSSEQLFKAGPHGATWLSMARAANAALPHLSPQEQDLVETRILNHWPELIWAKKLINDLANGQPEEDLFFTRQQVLSYLRWNGHEQWSCLKNIDQGSLSLKARLKFAQLDRKFTGEKPEEPNTPEAKFVPPPIGMERAKFMSNSDWISAISAYRDSREDQRGRGEWVNHTGARGLAGLLRGRAKEEPERFAHLLHQIPFDTPQIYFNEILNGLAEGQPKKETLKSAIRFVHVLPDRSCCEGISRLLQTFPTLAEEDDIFSILLWYVNNGPAATDGQADQKRTQELLLTPSQLTQRGSFTQVRSGYYDRGIAAEALAAVLWDCAPRLEAGVRVLHERIEQETLESVRCFLTEPIYSVLHHDKRRGAELLKQLVMRPERADLLPLSTFMGNRILFYILHSEAEIGRELLDLLLNSVNEEQQLLGAFHLFREAFYDEVFASRANTLAIQSEKCRKLAANSAATHLPDAAYQDRAVQQLIQFFDDPSEEVRTEAAECFREIWNLDITPYRHLMRAFIESRAFETDSFSLFHLLIETHQKTTEEVILAAERVLSLSEQADTLSAPTSRHRGMHSLDDLLLREYRATDCYPELRKRILDILDRMLVLGLYGADKVIQEHER